MKRLLTATFLSLFLAASSAQALTVLRALEESRHVGNAYSPGGGA